MFVGHTRKAKHTVRSKSLDFFDLKSRIELVLYFTEAALSFVKKEAQTKGAEMCEKSWIVFDQLQQLHGDLATGFSAEISTRIQTDISERVMTRPHV